MKDTGNLNLAQLIATEDAQWNKPTPPDAPVNEPIAVPVCSDMDAIDAKVNPRLTKLVRHGIAELPNPSNQTIALVGGRACFVLPDELRQGIVELQKQFDDAMELALKYTPRKAGEDYRAHHDGMTTEVLTTGSVDKFQGVTLQDFETAYRQKMVAAIHLTKTFAPKARELLAPHVSRYVELVRAWADQQAENEQSRCESIGVAWEPSNWLLTLYKCADYVEEHAGRGSVPKDCASVINFANE